MGDGKTNPFGTNGTGGGGGKAPPFDQTKQKNPQKSYQQVFGIEYGGASGEPPGGLTPFKDADKNVNPERAREIGPGSVGSSQLPFRLNGPGKK